MMRLFLAFSVRRIVALVALAALVIPISKASAASPNENLATVFAFAKKAVVFIVGATARGAQSGSGFVISSDATSSTIVTANHVVEGTSQIDVIFDSSDQERYPAQVIKRDHNRDVAVLKVNVGGRTPLPLEDAKDVKEGMSIAVIGYPRATLQFFRRIEGDDLRPSIHSGIVSAVRLNGEIIQFDAAIDHGDSGGPIIDATNGKVVAIVRGSPLDLSYTARGLEQALPGSGFGPSEQTIAAVLSGTGNSEVAQTSQSTAALSEEHPPTQRSISASGADSASYRVGFGVPNMKVTGDAAEGEAINDAVNASALERLQSFLKRDNELYLIPLQLSANATTDPQRLLGFCDDSRLNAIAFPAYSWHLTGGPRRNIYGNIVGYNGTAEVTMQFLVFDCFAMPFFVEQDSKTENRFFAHRTPDREIVDMANDLLDKLMNDFATRRSAQLGAWNNLLKAGIAIDPSDTRYHSMLYFTKKPEGIQVFVVAPGGPADKAGLRKQDIILSINGVEVSSLSRDELLHRMDAPTYTFEVQRPGGKASITVHALKYSDLVQSMQH